MGLGGFQTRGLIEVQGEILRIRSKSGQGTLDDVSDDILDVDSSDTPSDAPITLAPLSNVLGARAPRQTVVSPFGGASAKTLAAAGRGAGPEESGAWAFALSVGVFGSASQGFIIRPFRPCHLLQNVCVWQRA